MREARGPATLHPPTMTATHSRRHRWCRRASLGLLMAQCLGSVFCELLIVQDFLSPALSPAALLGTLPRHVTNQSVTAGDLDHALSTMHFHRSMMNEYQCHSFLADEILAEVNPLESRTGEPAGFTPQVTRGGHGQDQLLTDQGSESYRDWLQKSSQLEQMYGRGTRDDTSGPGGYETGDVTGYATVQGGKEESHYHFPSPPEFGSQGGSWPGADSGGLGWHDNSGPGWGWEEQESGKGLALKDLFDLALTALAFLAFGLFILNLIMTCFAKTPNVNLMMNIPTTPPTATRRLHKREVLPPQQLNELAYRVLTSVDKLLELQEDSNHVQNRCLEYTLCDNNKYSRALNDKNRIWLPVWSLGLSWIAGKHGAGSSLGNIRASVLGLGDADCASIYPHCTRSRSTLLPKQRPYY